MSMDRYAEQLHLTMLSKTPEIILWNYMQLAEVKISPNMRAPWQSDGGNSFRYDDMVVPFTKNGKTITPTTMARFANQTLHQTDQLVGALGKPIGLVSYKPYHSSGEDFLQNYLGMIGLPMDMHPQWVDGKMQVLLTEQAAKDPQIVEKIKQQLKKGGDVIISFRPRSSNTQLIEGQVTIDPRTGRIVTFNWAGELDMIDFKIDARMDRRDHHNPLPDQSTTEATFKFLGNNIKSTITSFYNCQKTLPDSIDSVDDPAWMKKLRPKPLGKEEKKIYASRQQQEQTEEQNDTTRKTNDRLKEVKDVAWDFIGDNLISSRHTETENITLNMSPLLNPLYMGYSHSKGISYKLDIGARYAWNTHRYLTLNPQFGYNFKGQQFYYTIPLRMTYNPKRNGFAEFTWGNGNRTSHAALGEAFQKVMGDTIAMPDFKDEYFQLINNVAAYDWLEVTTGMVYHRRRSSDKALMQQAGLADKFLSFAPSLTVRLSPWQKGPTLTANYERGIKGVLQSNLAYERWEFDAVYKHQNKSVRILNLRLGTGFYTQRSTDYFVDFANFRDNNLPTGWEDDWTGQFQLLDSRWYNESNYYVRSHVSYDSPLLMLSWLPWVGRIVETERIYISALSIEHTRPYFELGYGFQNRFFSTGIFASFLNTHFQSFGCKFTIELFRRW
jgi:hypothetical protein